MLYRRAEEALLLSKNSGKNKVSTLPHIIRQDKSSVAAILSRSTIQLIFTWWLNRLFLSGAKKDLLSQK